MWLSKDGKPHGNRKHGKQSEAARLLKWLDRTGECWLFFGGLSDGYGVFGDTHGKSVPAHRKAYELWVGPIPVGMLVLHRCDVRRCCRPSHLFLGDAKTNAEDAVAKGRQTRGAMVGVSKLNEDLVREIRAKYVPGKYGKGCWALGKEYGLHGTTVYDVLTGKTWKHV